MAYLKPQKPLQDKDGNYIYPLTMAEQVMMPSGNRLNADMLSIDLSDSITSEPNPINADTLGGYTAEELLSSNSVKMNYCVVGSETQPEQATENTIWVNTNVPVTKHKFSKKEPKNPIEGMVWFATGDGSNVAFDRLSMDGVEYDEIAPFRCAQYVNGSWVDKTAKSYQGGKWVDWWNGELFDNGNQFENITGGWTSSGYSHSSYSVEEASIIDGNIALVGIGNKMVMRGTDDIVDLSKYTKLHWSGNVVSYASVSGAKVSADLFVVSQKENFVQNILAQHELNVDTGSFSVDINISGIDAGYILVRAGTSTSCVSNTQKIWME